MKTKLPSHKDFCSHKILYPDEEVAIEHFLGKTLKEAKKLFIENDLYYADDLRWMGKKAFQYYLPAFVDFITSNDMNISSDTLNSFVSLLKSKLEYDIESIKSCRTILIETLKYCLENYLKFNVDIEVYGDLKGEVSALLQLVKKL